MPILKRRRYRRQPTLGHEVPRYWSGPEQPVGDGAPYSRGEGWEIRVDSGNEPDVVIAEYWQDQVYMTRDQRRVANLPIAGPVMGANVLDEIYDTPWAMFRDPTDNARGFPPPEESYQANIEPWPAERGGARPHWTPFAYRTPFESISTFLSPHVGTVKNSITDGQYYYWPAPILDTRLLHLMPYRVPFDLRGAPYPLDGDVSNGYAPWQQQSGPA